MEKTTILYNTNDQTDVSTLEKNLNEHGIVWIDSYELDPKIAIEHQILTKLASSEYIICIISKNLIDSNQTSDQSIEIKDLNKIIILYLDETSKEKHFLDAVNQIIDGYENKNTFKELIPLLSQKDALETYTKIQSTFKENPFAKVRAEFFDSSHLANMFFEPEREKYDLLVSPKAVILEGGRGSGKTMILRSLAALPAITRSQKSTFNESGLSYFGVYMRLDRGGFVLANNSELQNIPKHLSRQLFLDDFNLQFTQTLLETIQDCNKEKKLSISSHDENLICNEILKILKPDNDLNPKTINDLLQFINEEKRKIRKYIGRVLLHDTLEYDGCVTSIETFKETCKIILERIIKSTSVTIFLLLDEYENLLPDQQIIVNSLIKLSDKITSLKIGTKFAGVYTRKTLFGEQDIQTPHDYSNITLDYNLRNDDSKKQYENLLLGITKKLLSTSGFKQTDIKKLLKPSFELKLTEDDLKDQLRLMLKEKDQDILLLDDKEINQKIAYYKDALIFRALTANGFRKGKTYAGFETFVLISSGIIRQFLELCAMSLYVSQEDSTKISNLDYIDPKSQTKAVHSVSAASLEKIAPGVEDLGIIIQRFLIDIGDIFRDRLLNDNNEPETIRITVKESRDTWNGNLTQVYQIGIRESIFQNIEDHNAMRPKQQNYARPTEFIINRIFTPVLEISPRARWRTSFSSKDLECLLDGTKRSDVIKQMIPKRKSKKSLKESDIKSLDEFNQSGDE